MQSWLIMRLTKTINWGSWSAGPPPFTFISLLLLLSPHYLCHLCSSPPSPLLSSPLHILFFFFNPVLLQSREWEERFAHHQMRGSIWYTASGTRSWALHKGCQAFSNLHLLQVFEYFPLQLFCEDRIKCPAAPGGIINLRWHNRRS